MPEPLSFVTTEKEREILRHLFRVKIATFPQIHRNLFGKVVKSAVSKRLQRLLKCKLIHKGLAEFQEKHTQVFYLNPKTVDLLHGNEGDQLGRYQAQSGAIDHDLILGDIRAKVIQFKHVRSYWTENELQCLKDCSSDPRLLPFILLRSDAVLEIFSDGQSMMMPLELEVSRKANSRYNEKISEYYKREGLKSVLFISGTSAIQNAVMQIERGIAGSNRPKFYYSLASDVFGDTKPLHFSNLRGDQFVLDEAK